MRLRSQGVCIGSALLMMVLAGGGWSPVRADEVSAELQAELELSNTEPAPEEPAAAQEAAPGSDTFTIRRFLFAGATVFPPEQLRSLLGDLRGPGRTAAAVETARDRIEKFYRDQGYLTTLVNIPEQMVDSGFIYLQVIEGTVGQSDITGNRRVAAERIRALTPGLQPGAIVYLPRIKRELTTLAATPDCAVTPALSPGKELGTTDVELAVKDRTAWHGSLELSNRNSLGTTDLRLNAALRYDDLWQRGHSLSAQFQTSPQDPEEVKVFSGSYTLAPPWSPAHRLVLYGVSSDSATAFGDSFKTVGEGIIVGIRYITPLPPVSTYYHNLTVGFDYKKFKESQDISTTISYLPISLSYGAVRNDGTGNTRLTLGLALAFRGLVTDIREFENKRYQAQGNYLVFTPRLERQQRLPYGLELNMKIEGQLADQPLISNEQYSAGGMDSARGYYESEVSGDDALFFSLELRGPDQFSRLGLTQVGTLIPYLFFDHGALTVQSPQAEQISHYTVQSTGIGLRGTFGTLLSWELTGAFALHDSRNSNGGTRTGDGRALFRVKGEY